MEDFHYKRHCLITTACYLSFFPQENRKKKFFSHFLMLFSQKKSFLAQKRDIFLFRWMISLQKALPDAYWQFLVVIWREKWRKKFFSSKKKFFLIKKKIFFFFVFLIKKKIYTWQLTKMTFLSIQDHPRVLRYGF